MKKKILPALLAALKNMQKLKPITAAYETLFPAKNPLHVVHEFNQKEGHIQRVVTERMFWGTIILYVLLSYLFPEYDIIPELLEYLSNSAIESN